MANDTEKPNLNPWEMLSRRQETAIAALLCTPTLEKAAKKAGVSVSSLKRWLKNEDFSKAYGAARKEAINRSIGILTKSCANAAIVLDAITRDKKQPPAARVSAARSTIVLALKGLDVVVMNERLEKVENLLAEKERQAWPPLKTA